MLYLFRATRVVLAFCFLYGAARGSPAHAALDWALPCEANLNANDCTDPFLLLLQTGTPKLMKQPMVSRRDNALNTLEPMGKLAVVATASGADANASSPGRALALWNKSRQIRRRGNLTGSGRLAHRGRSGPNPFGDLINSIGNALGNIGDTLQDIAQEMGRNLSRSLVNGGAGAGLIDFPGQLPDGFQVELGGNSLAHINMMLCTLVAVLLIVGVLGCVADCYCPRPAGRPSISVCAVLLVTYLFLIPGLAGTLFSVNFVVRVLDTRMEVTHDSEGNPAPFTESALTLIRTLFRSGGLFGGCLLTLYAIIVPAAKLVLLARGEQLRFSESVEQRTQARWCIRIVQVVSKWASPDMFAYILLLYLFRMMDDPPTVEAQSQLDVGFSTFGLFCISSTMASLAIRLPEKSEGSSAGTWQPSGSVRALLLLVMAALFVAFFWLLGIGLTSSCLSLRLEASLLLDGIPIPAFIRPIIMPAIQDITAELSSQVHADVDIWNCFVSLSVWARRDLNCLFAIVMLVGFAVVIPIIDVVVTAGVSAYMLMCSHEEAEKDLHSIKKVSYVTSHIGMLDVFIMGVIVVSFAGSSYQEQGVVLAREVGIWRLFGAEVVHYTLYYLSASLT